MATTIDLAALAEMLLERLDSRWRRPDVSFSVSVHQDCIVLSIAPADGQRRHRYVLKHRSRGPTSSPSSARVASMTWRLRCCARPIGSQTSSPPEAPGPHPLGQSGGDGVPAFLSLTEGAPRSILPRYGKRCGPLTASDPRSSVRRTGAWARMRPSVWG
jgi:hypothetical protein